MKVLTRMQAGNAVNSVFGEYSKSLYKHYGIFGIDGAYLGSEYDEGNILNRYSYYGGGSDNVTIETLQLLTDNGASALLESIVEYMESQTLLGLLDEVLGQADTWDQVELDESKVEESVQGLGNVKEQIESSAGQDVEGVEEGNVLKDFNGFDLDIIFPLIVKTQDVSDTKLASTSLPSNRTLNTGYGSAYSKNVNPLNSKVFLSKYIKEMFPFCNMVDNSAQENADNILQYQVEYILIGKESDEANLKAVVHKLLTMRTPINYAYLSTDAVKQAEAHVLASSLSLASGGVVPEPIIYQALLWAWSYCESIVEVKSLVEGKKVKLIKNGSDWQFGLSSLFTFTKGEIAGHSQEGGLSYQEYLKILLYLDSSQDILNRVMDMIEYNIQTKYDEETFFIDHCVTRLHLNVLANIGNGYTYEFPVQYGFR